jgi:hypothetical protein
MNLNHKVISPLADGARVMTLAQFCIRNKISQTTFHKLRGLGRAPRILEGVGRCIRISVQAESDWIRARENPSDAEARLLHLEAAARIRSARKAAQISVASHLHCSKRNRPKLSGT